MHPGTPDPRLRQRLEEAATGLVYSSEGDYPFELFFLPGGAAGGPLTPGDFARRVGAPAGAPAREVALEDFLAHHTERSDPWDGEAQRIRPRYERLIRVLRESLRGVRVFRTGEVQVRCYLVGDDGHGNLAGLATTAIET